MRAAAAAHIGGGPGAPGPQQHVGWKRVLGLAVAAVVVGSLVGAAVSSAPSVAASPTMTLDPAAAPAGATVRLQADHLLAFVPYQLTWDRSATGEPQLETDAQGSLSADWIVPPAAPGAHLLSMFPVGHISGDTTASVASAGFTVALGDALIPGSPTGGPTSSPEDGPTATPTVGAGPRGGGASPSADRSTPGTIAPPAAAPPPPPKPKPTPHPGAPCGTSLQSLVNGAASGSTVYLGACTYHESVRINKPLALVGPATIDGDNSRQGISVTASHVTIDGITVRRVVSGAYQGAVNVQGVSDFTLRHAVIRDSSTICLAIAGGTGHVVTSSVLTGCGKEGYFLNGVTNTVFQGDRISGNNAAGKYNPNWEAGGGKAIASSHLTFKGNQSYDNDGAGFWCDEGCSSVTFSGNRAYRNRGAGIMFEISSGA
ncbi:MAG: nitrous oxide reductase family maturation protein NosD, partial [Candidatus Limnocylindrales bacterium]